MAKQALLWTALPNGYSQDKQSLRVSVLLSPRLDPEAAPPQLASFPDFVNWPATLASAQFVLRFGAAWVAIAGDDITSDSRIDTGLGRPDAKCWTALFPATTFVRGFGFKDLSDNQVLSYPAAKIDALVRNLYGQLAASAQEDLPKVSEVLGNPAWGDVIAAVAQNDRRFLSKDGTMRDPQRQFSVFADGGFGTLKGTARDLALFQLFHTPPATPKVDQYAVPPGHPKSYAKWLGYKQTALPKPQDFEQEIDFHQIVAAMNQYPTLLRRLGLVVDLLIAKTAFSGSPNGVLQVEVNLPSGAPAVTRAPDVSARTRALLDATRFQAVPRPNPQPGDYRAENGLLVLDPTVFRLVQVDGDGAGLKVMNFARTLGRLQQKQDERRDPVSQQEREVGAPALRNAGLMLIHVNRGGMLKNGFARQKQFNAAAELIQNGANQQPPPELFAEDSTRGYRVDIWDRTTQVWRSLCRREARYNINAGEVLIELPEEEGTVRLGATKSPDPASNSKLIWLHEALVSWPGWSLCARAPGKTIHHNHQDHTDPVNGAEAEVPPGLRLETAFGALAGSLPRLRYGRRYWIRLRIVDLAGNSLPLRPEDFGPEEPIKNAVAYLRYEPVSAPAIALVKPTAATVEAPAEGESMERMAVRTFNDTPAQNTVPTTQRARRFAVPARTTQREAEHHGMLDQAGIVDPAFFAMLAAKDNSLAEEKILTAGPLGTPVETGYAVLQEGGALPYLPDPLAVEIAARVFDLPGFNPNTVIRIPLYPAGTTWPEAAPFLVELLEDPGGAPHFDATKRTLFIPVPKAVRATLRLSVKPTQDALELLGVWSWLTPAQKAALHKMALNGQHWMLTPWRTIELVHAVQRPLIAPEILKHTVNRGLAATFALPNFVARCSVKSTDHLDLLAQWNEPFENVKQPTGENRARTDHAFAVKITEANSYAGTPDYKPEGPDVIRAGGVFHDLVENKIHEFNDTRYRRIEYWFEATTTFREFMPASILTEDVNGTPEPTDKNITVTGPKVRTWIPSSAPPPAPEVLYVVPTFGWVRSEKRGGQGSWRRGGGLRIYLNRPWNVSGYGEMLGVVVPSAAFTGDPAKDPAQQPLKNFVTQWGNDPIWLSPFVAGAAPRPGNFPLARTAPDPGGTWLPSFAPKDQDGKLIEADQPPGPFRTSGLTHPEAASVAPQFLVDVASHDVSYDEERQLWYSDIEVTWGASYYPFIRLALARYQPVSVIGAHLSHIVLADFMPLAADRWLNVTHTTEARTQRVSVFGSTYSDSSAHVEAEHAPSMSVKLPDGTVVTLEAPGVARSSVIEVWVERFDPALGRDFGWQREPDAVVQRDLTPLKKRPAVAKKATLAKQRARAKELLRRREFDVLIRENLIDKIFITPMLWEGTVTLPQAPGGETRYRLAIAEYEEYLVDDPRPYDPVPTKKDRRLVFLEYVDLG